MGATHIHILREADADEPRVAMTPAGTARLVKLGAEVTIDPGLGSSLGIIDERYCEQGATVAANPAEGLARAGIVLTLNPPPEALCRQLGSAHVLIGFLKPFSRPEIVVALGDSGATSICMELIPRTTLAQKMDALSSQASLAGYAAVILAAERSARILPMMMTPAGTIAATRVLVIGAGVAGLQAIATAKRLGARVQAYDTRPAVAEEVKSLGATFVDLGVTGEQTEQGYAKPLTEEQLDAQRQALAKHCANADIVITTAQVFGRRAPIILTESMLDGMAPGSIAVDGAADSGGNVEGVTPGKETLRNGVRLIALANLPGHVARDASDMYASNLCNLIEHFWDPEGKGLIVTPEDDLMGACLATREGQIVNARLQDLIAERQTEKPS